MFGVRVVKFDYCSDETLLQFILLNFLCVFFSVDVDVDVILIAVVLWLCWYYTHELYPMDFVFDGFEE